VTVSKPSSDKQLIRIVAVHRDPPDIEKLAKAFLMLADDLAKKEQCLHNAEKDSQRMP